MSLRTWIIALGLMLSLAAAMPGPVGKVIGPYDYKGYLSFAYPEGDDPINIIVFTVDEIIAPSLLIVNVPPEWSWTYLDGTLSLFGGLLNPGEQVDVEVSLDRYHEEDAYDLEAVGTTTAGESSYSVGILLVGQLILLRFLDLVASNSLPIWGGTLGLGLLDIFLRTRTKKPEIDSVVDELQASIVPVVTLPEGREWDDDFLKHFNSEDAQWELSDADYARWKHLKDEDATAEWVSAQESEDQLQSLLESMVRVEMQGLSEDIFTFSTAVQTYSGAMEKLLKESQQIGMLYNEWDKPGGVKDMAWWGDLAMAIIDLSRLAISLGKGTARLAIRLLSGSDEAAEAAVKGISAADEIVEGASGAAQAEKGGVRVSEADEIYDGADLAKFEDEIEELLGRSFTDYAEALPEAARLKGFYTGFSDAERVIIQRLSVKARLASKGNPVPFDQADLAWLHRMSQNPDFWENLSKGAALDLDFRMYQMVDDVELGWLRNLAESPEAANAARNLPIPSFPLTPGGATLPPPLPPSASATLPYPGAITLPHGPPPGAATLPGGGAITLPPPTQFSQGVTLPGGDVITLPHAPPLGATLPGGGAITLPPPKILPNVTVPDAGVITLPPGKPMNLVNLGDAALNPSGLGGLTPTAPPPSPPSTDAVDVIQTGLKGGGTTSQGYQIKLQIDRIMGGGKK
jgi:hypothetical protein